MVGHANRSKTPKGQIIYCSDICQEIITISFNPDSTVSIAPLFYEGPLICKFCKIQNSSGNLSFICDNGDACGIYVAGAMDSRTIFPCPPGPGALSTLQQHPQAEEGTQEHRHPWNKLINTLDHTIGIETPPVEAQAPMEITHLGSGIVHKYESELASF
ncbi:MAG: hypothetical protein Ct9H300mP9_3220 [Candidatus Neomarinimicrobiota bacterium]|nr:MAG: hypothetical protein Ct9H300mP9_3220 [Candidatus Neomarinimicrobiota bacterium]